LDKATRNACHCKVFVAAEVADGLDAHSGEKFSVLVCQAGQRGRRGVENFLQALALVVLEPGPWFHFR
jgi:hypothetical protein